MKNKILQITKENPVKFDELLTKINQYEQITKLDLSNILKELSYEQQLLEVDKTWHNLSNYETKQGYIQANINNLAWISDTDKSNDFGVAFDLNDNLKILFNKKDIPLKSLVEYKGIPVGENRTLAYATNILDVNPTLLIVGKKHRNWTILNTQYNLEIKDNQIEELQELKEANNDDIYILKYENNSFNIGEKLGNIHDSGIESLIVEKLVGLKNPPEITPNDLNKTSNQPSLLDLPFVTIDATTTKDVDDAIAIKKITDTEFKLYVAIADVDSLIKLNSPADLHAQQAATTFYLTDKRVPMFDPKISEDSCSLNLGEIRNAMICEVSVKNNEIQDYSFYPSKIRVKYKISYDDVDNILNDRYPSESFFATEHGFIQSMTCPNDVPQECRELLFNLQDFALMNKKVQPEKQYWFTQTPEFELNENKKIDHLFLKNEGEQAISQTIVETSMLKANICAAKFLKTTYPYIGIFRNQIQPENTDKPKSALYESVTDGHWGLSEETYTHFTSPIRRYCDLVAHRLIKAAINKSEAPYTAEEVDKIALNLNQQQYISKQCYIKEKSLLLGQYLSELIKDKKISNKYNLIDYNDKGVLFRNKQNIDVFLHYFKTDRDSRQYLENNMVEDRTKQKHIDHINENWQVKCFIDYFEWHQDRKSVETKFYKKENLPTNKISP